MRLRNSYANVVSTFALLVAVSGGAAVAAGELGKSTVGTKQLKNDAVVSKKVDDGSLLAADFAPGQLPAGPQGPVGPTGPRGLQGQEGPPGAPGANAASYLGTINDQGIVPAYTCASGSAGSGAFKVGDTAVLAPSYGAVGYHVQVLAGRVVTAGSLPYTICNMSGTALPQGSYRVDVWRVVGPAGARPGPELSAQRVG